MSEEDEIKKLKNRIDKLEHKRTSKTSIIIGVILFLFGMGLMFGSIDMIINPDPTIVSLGDLRLLILIATVIGVISTVYGIRWIANA